MKVNFKIKTIAVLAKMLSVYGELYVTSLGQMFRKESDMKEAVRTKNMIIDDPNTYVGFIKMSKDDVTPEKLRKYAKNVETFNELFKDAVIPPVKDAQKPFERATEEKPELAQETADEIDKLLFGEAEEKASSEPAKPATDKKKLL